MRGDDPRVRQSGNGTEVEFPACAGMIREESQEKSKEGRVPRMRGDDPILSWGNGTVSTSSPHARG